MWYNAFMRRILLLHLLFGLLCAGLMFASCSSETTPRADQPSMTFADLPPGLGRGYPVASIDGIDNVEAGVQVGEHAPNFRLQLDDGRTLTLEDLRGRPLLINHWATWCGPCRLEMPEIMKAAAANPELVVLAVNMMQARSQIEPFAAEFNMDVPVVIDPTGEVSDLYAVRGLPTTILIDRQGMISAIWAGLLTEAKLDEMLKTLE